MSIDRGTDRLHPVDRDAREDPVDPVHLVDPVDPVDLVDLGEEYHDWVAAFHVATLPHGLFPRMGRRFVARWHRAHMDSPHGVGHVAVRDGAPVGFALGSTDRAAHVAWILAHRRGALLRAGVPALVLRPRLAASFLRTRAGAYARRLLRPAARPPASSQQPAATDPVAVLEAVAVLPEARTQGIGSRLVDLVLSDAARAGATRVELVTKQGGSGAAGFYVRGAWEEVGRHQDRDGDGVLRFRIDPRRPRTL